MTRLSFRSILSASVIWPWVAVAGPYGDAEHQLREAYGNYRTALFQSNSGNVDATGKSMQELSEKWTVLSDEWAAQAPPQYADDVGLTATLSRVGEIIQQASDEVAAGELPKAHATLEAMRAELGELHERNWINTFSDRMNAYHEVMESIIEMGAEGVDEVGLPKIAEAAAVLDYLAQDIVMHPAPEATDPAYAALADGMVHSVEALFAAARSGDVAKVKDAIGGLKAPYAKFFVKFG